MTATDESQLVPPTNAGAIVANCRAIGPELEAMAEECDRLRKLPLRAVELMQRAGAFRIAMPRAWGGPELSPMDQVRVIEELSAANGSAGWCAMIGSDGGYFSAYVDRAESERMWADIDTPTAITAFPPGRAVAVEGGYRVTGRWPYGSGSTHAGWAGGHCVIFDGETPRVSESGTPQTLIAFAPAGEFVTFEDTWNTTGLRGSGSCDWGVTDVFVPAERCAAGFGGGTPNREGALYTYPMMFLCNQPGAPLGLARAAIDTFIEIAETKKMFGNSIRKAPHVHDGLGQATARYRSARGYVMDAQAALWDALTAGRPPSKEERMHFRLSIIHAHKECQFVADLMFELAGSAAHAVPSKLDRIMRDLRMANQHVAASRAAYGTAGQHLLGLELPPGSAW